MAKALNESKVGDTITIFQLGKEFDYKITNLTAFPVYSDGTKYIDGIDKVGAITLQTNLMDKGEMSSEVHLIATLEKVEV